MNIHTVRFDLYEALVDLQQLVDDLADGGMQPDDTPELAVRLGHILDHICLAWNRREMSPEQILASSYDEFERSSNTVPNFQGERILGEIAVA